jgi:DNA segregation ATPase FtsK/SpoIIIE, S-DNA-T family
VSKQLSVTQTVELVDRLKRAAREFAATEEKITREFRSKIDTLEKRFRDETETHAAALAENLSRTETDYQTAKEALQARYERRKARIARAQHTSQRQGLKRIEAAEGQQTYPIQKGLLDIKRQREDALKANDAALADFHARLATNRESFVELESSAYKAMRGYGSFRRRLRKTASPQTGPAGDEHQLLEQLQQLHTRTAAELPRFRKALLPKLFSYFPLWLTIILIAIAAAALVPFLGQPAGVLTPVHKAGALAAVLIILASGLHIRSKRAANPLASSIAKSLETARQLHNAALEKSQAHHESEHQRIEKEAKDLTQWLEQNWQHTHKTTAATRASWPQLLEAKLRRTTTKHEELFRARLAALDQNHTAATGRWQADGDAFKQRSSAGKEAKVAKLNSDYAAQWEALVADWKALTQPVYEAVAESNRIAADQFWTWQSPQWHDWQPPATFLNAARFGQLDVDLKKVCELLPRDPRLAFPGPAAFSLPLMLSYPQEGSLLFETTKSGNEPVIAAINNIIFRLLAASPAGKVSLTIIDPVALGQNFATVMHLADYEDNVINGRIWTQPTQIEERLADLNEHMEKVIQMYLRNEYETIADYNAEAGNIAEKYHFVVIADFPANFTQTAVRRLQRIAASGARCGVYTLIHWDQRQTAPPDFFPEELRKASVVVATPGTHLELTHPPAPRAPVILDSPPPPELATDFLHKLGQLSRGSNRVEVPFDQVAPAAGEIWSLDTTEELRVPIGRSGASKLQYLAIGKGTRQHTLIAGKTGSGKSTLFHVMITNLSLWCSPEQVEFYLVDFKKGVEFKGYAARRLPHARVVAIESDREFGLSVLQRVDEELKRRGDLFRKLGVQDVAGYKKAGGGEAMPRSLLLIDEFQEFFVEDDRISQAANVLLDRIVRQGRAFGIHVLLGSQTLGGAYTLARATMGQMVIRIALQCNEADAYLIMDENNAAPRLLSRPGEGIYNDMAGASEGNSPFQAVWLPDEERDAALQRVRELADAKAPHCHGPIVFEGNAPADVRENEPLRTLLEATSIRLSTPSRMWLGAPNSIKGPTEAVFSRRSGNNLLIVGQRDEAARAILSLGLIALAAQYPKGRARFVWLENAPAARDSAERASLEQLVAATHHEVTLATAADLPRVMKDLADDLQKRAENEQAAATETFVFVHGLQNFKKLRQDEDFGFSMDDADKSTNAGVQFQKLITEGSSHGIHLIATIDTYNNVNRSLGRKGLTEFEMRVLFQMSSNDSASLCDDPKASILGLHRALFYNEQEGTLETFRPYALPSSDWLAEAGRQLARLLAT